MVPVMTQRAGNRGRLEREGIHIYTELLHTVVQQKLTTLESNCTQVKHTPALERAEMRVA